MDDNIFSHVLMPLAIAFIMWGIGINLKFADFRRIFVRPKAIVTGLVAQMILLPAIAFMLNMFWPISPVLKVGFIIIAACPGGTTSNLVTLLLRGRLALSVTLTAFNSFLILFTIPAVVGLALTLYLGRQQEISLPFFITVKDIFLTVLLPTLLGMLVRHYYPHFAESIKKTVSYLVTAFLLFVFLGIILFEKDETGNILEYSNLIFPAFLLNAVTMFVGFYFARWFAINHRGQFTIAIQVGLQNSALAIYVASKLLGQSEMAMVAVVYGSFTFFTTAFWAWIMKRFL